MNKLTSVAILLAFSCAAYAQHESLKIGPGDELQVRVLETSDLNETASVTDAGLFPMLIGNPVAVAGLTPIEAADAIKKALVDENYVLTPHVIVTISRYATQNVSVLGEVQRPGSFAILTPRSIVDVISLAGGLSGLGDRHIGIKRKGTGVTDHYYLSNDSQKTFDESVLIQPGDQIFVPKVGVVYILGDVGRPGGYTMDTNDSRLTALQAVTRAGAMPGNAAPNGSRLIRRAQDGTYYEQKVNMAAIQKGKQPDFQLQADDILYVPFSYLRNAALQLTGIVSAASSAAIYRY